MTYQPQHFTAPDGTEMVVLRADDYERLRALAADGEDVADLLVAEARIRAGEGTVPGEVVKLMIVEGLSPVGAWRRYRGLSQATLADKAGLSQVWVGRIEAGGGYGSQATRRKLAAALDAPVWALDEEEDMPMPSSPGPEKGRKYLPLQNFLRASEKDRLTLSFDKIAELVGGLPKSAIEHPAWWANGVGHSQAVSWMDAGYRVEANQRLRVATFIRQ